MKKLVLILGLVSGGYSQVTPCEDYACDSLAVRAILDTNGLSLVSVAMASTRNLEGRINEIKIVDQGIVILPENVGIVTELTRLILFGNNITEIPNSIGKLTNLEYLHLDGNSLDILQDSITLLSNLDTLSLANNQLISLPDSIGKLEKLEYLNLNANTLSEIPDSFGKLINLKNLILYKNEIADLPESIVNVTNLENLRIDENHLCSLSTEIIVWADWYQQDWMSSQICIVPKSITIISPNGGEVWEVGSTQAITWTSTGDITQVNIEWLQDGDALLELSSPILNILSVMLKFSVHSFDNHLYENCLSVAISIDHDSDHVPNPYMLVVQS